MHTDMKFISSLKDEHARLGRLLGVIDSGRWWTIEHPGSANVEALKEQVAAIKHAVDVIDNVVGQLGSN